MTTKELIEEISKNLVSPTETVDEKLFMSRVLELKSRIQEISAADFSDLSDYQMISWIGPAIYMFVMAAEVNKERYHEQNN